MVGQLTKIFCSCPNKSLCVSWERSCVSNIYTKTLHSLTCDAARVNWQVLMMSSSPSSSPSLSPNCHRILPSISVSLWLLFWPYTNPGWCWTVSKTAHQENSVHVFFFYLCTSREFLFTVHNSWTCFAFLIGLPGTWVRKRDVTNWMYISVN